MNNLASRDIVMFRGVPIRKTRESITLDYVAKFLPSNPVILEAGAHFGGDTFQMAHRWPGATIHAFEPVSHLFAQLEANTAQFANVRRYLCALGTKLGLAQMYVSSGTSDGSSSLLLPTGHIDVHPDVYFNHSQIVEVSTIASWAAQNGVERIDFMWLDMQGAEMDALMHAGKILDTVTLIQAEVSLMQMYDKSPVYREFDAWMQSKGFFAIREDLPYADMGNVLYLRP